MDLPQVYVDPLQGQQVLFNLIRNALEAMDEDNRHEHVLRITVRQADPAQVEFLVEDSGPGMAPEVRDRAFDNFLTTKDSGMGVGLAICKQIVEAHGGLITAGQSGELGGAAFRFTLPTMPGGAPLAP